MGLNDKIVSILSEDLGPSAQSFYARQCTVHLNKQPDQITKDDIDELAKWIFVGVKLIVGEDVANKINKKVLALKS